MEVFEIYADNKFCGFTESLQDAMVAASLLVSDFDVRIEHPCEPSPTAIWQHDSESHDWVRIH